MITEKIDSFKKFLLTPLTKMQKNKNTVKQHTLEFSNRAFMFSPGIALFTLGLIIFFAPVLLIAAAGFFLLFFGIFFTFVAYKFMKIKKSLDKVTGQLKGKVVVQGVEILDADEDFFDEDYDEEDLEEIQTKKVILH